MHLSCAPFLNRISTSHKPLFLSSLSVAYKPVLYLIYMCMCKIDIYFYTKDGKR